MSTSAKLSWHGPYLQNIEDNFIEQIEIHHIIDSLKSFRRVIVIRCPVKQESKTTINANNDALILSQQGYRKTVEVARCGYNKHKQTQRFDQWYFSLERETS